MAVLTVNKVVRAGLSEAGLFVAAAAGGDLVPNDGNTWVEFINTSGGIITVSIHALIDGLDTIVRTVAVPATTGRVKAGPFPPAWNNTSDQISLTYSGVTTFTVAAFALGD